MNIKSQYRKPIDVILVAGGFGTRMKGLATKYGCKSLIPINGVPCVRLLIMSIRKAVPQSRIILCVDNESLVPGFEKMIGDIGNIEFFKDKHRGPVQTVYEAANKCLTTKVLIFWGNQLVSTDHIIKLLSVAEDAVALSTFLYTSENHSKIADIRGNFKSI